MIWAKSLNERPFEQNKAGALLCRVHPLENPSSRKKLEFKSNGKLNLSFAEEKAIRKIAGCAERWVEGGNDIRAHPCDYVHSVVDSSNLCAIEDVKAFGKQFDLRILFDGKATRETKVYVLD